MGAAPAGRQGVVWARPSRNSVNEPGIMTLDVDVIDTDGRVMIKIKGMAMTSRVLTQTGSADNQEFERLLESIYASAGLVPANGASQSASSVHFSDMLDEIFKASAT